MPKQISPKDAYKLIEKDHSALLIDVRSSMEYLFVGHPKGAVSIPWIDEPDWDINPNFVKEIRQLILGGACGELDSQPPVILICRSGKRSMEAGKVLVEDNIMNVYNIDTGFEGDLDDHHQRSTLNGWRHDGLPWEQC